MNGESEKMRKVLKNKIKILDKSDPWSQKERERITAYERNYIRILQIQYKISKKQAIVKYLKFSIASKGIADKQRRATKKFVSSMYPKHRLTTAEELPRHKKTKSERTRREAEIVRKEYKQRMKPFSPKFISFEQWLLYQKTHNKMERPQTIRMIKAHKKYPDDSLYQLSHGHHVGGGK